MCVVNTAVDWKVVSPSGLDKGSTSRWDEIAESAIFFEGCQRSMARGHLCKHNRVFEWDQHCSENPGRMPDCEIDIGRYHVVTLYSSTSRIPSSCAPTFPVPHRETMCRTVMAAATMNIMTNRTLLMRRLPRRN